MSYAVYVTLRGGDKLLRFAMDSNTGALDPEEEITLAGGPATVAVDPQRRYLYIARREARIVSSFGIDRKTGRLVHLGDMSTEFDPCCMDTDRRGKFLLCAYYESGGFSIHPINADGVAQQTPVERLHTTPGTHCIQTDPSNRFVFVTHVAHTAEGREGANAIFQYRFDERAGRLTPNSPARIVPQAPEGPRTLCFHPRRNLLYCTNEQGSSVTLYDFNPDTGLLTELQTVPNLPPEGFAKENLCSEIQITPSGKYVYAPNRGHDTIACHRVDENTGFLTPVGHVRAEAHNRTLMVDPTGRFVVAAGRDSGRVATYRIAQASGMLQPLAAYPAGAKPMGVIIVGLE